MNFKKILLIISCCCASALAVAAQTSSPKSEVAPSSKPAESGPLNFLKKLDQSLKKAAGNSGTDSSTYSPIEWMPVTEKFDAIRWFAGLRDRDRTQVFVDWNTLGSSSTRVRNPTLKEAPGLLDGAGEFKWGMTQSEVEALVNKRGAQFDSRKAQPGVETINYRGGSFAGEEVQIWTFSFSESGLFDVEVDYQYMDLTTFEHFRGFLAALREKYGMNTFMRDARFLILDLNREYISEKRRLEWNGDSGAAEACQRLAELQVLYLEGVVSDSIQTQAHWNFGDRGYLMLYAIGNRTVRLKYIDPVREKAAKENASRTSSKGKDL